MNLAPAEALTLRMASLLLRTPGDGDPTGPKDVAGVVTWFGAMQAQDEVSGRWSLGVRLPGFTGTDVLAALERREALRTWPMRGTVHLVPPRDARWMLDLMGVRALAGAAARRAHLGLSEPTAERAVEVLGEALAGGRRLTRRQCLDVLAEAGIQITGQLGYHLLWYASQRGVTCIAPTIGNEQTFVLLDEWVPDPHRPERDEALGIIALRYFRSHGPTTRQDFAGWTGLTAADAKRGIAVAGDTLTRVQVDDREMLLDRTLLDGAATTTGRTTTGRTSATSAPGEDGEDGEDGAMLALPGFDEYLLGFKDRSLMLDPAHQQAIIPGGNGMFQWTIVRDGRVIGTWKRSVSRGQLVVRVLPLVPLTARERSRTEDALRRYAHFAGYPLRVEWS